MPPTGKLYGDWAEESGELGRAHIEGWAEEENKALYNELRAAYNALVEKILDGRGHELKRDERKRVQNHYNRKYRHQGKKLELPLEGGALTEERDRLTNLLVPEWDESEEGMKGMNTFWHADTHLCSRLKFKPWTKCPADVNGKRCNRLFQTSSIRARVHPDTRNNEKNLCDRCKTPLPDPPSEEENSGGVEGGGGTNTPDEEANIMPTERGVLDGTQQTPGEPGGTFTAPDPGYGGGMDEGSPQDSPGEGTEAAAMDVDGNDTDGGGGEVAPGTSGGGFSQDGLASSRDDDQSFLDNLIRSPEENEVSSGGDASTTPPSGGRAEGAGQALAEEEDGTSNEEIRDMDMADQGETPADIPHSSRRVRARSMTEEDRSADTVLDAASRAERAEVRELQAALGALMLDSGLVEPLLFIAVKKGNKDVVQLLVEKGANLNRVSYDGETPLSIAAKEGQAEMVRVLVENGANVNQANDCDETPLWIAAGNGHLEVVRVLVEKKAEVEQADERGWTPLFIAAAKDHLEVVRLLEDNGANWN